MHSLLAIIRAFFDKIIMRLYVLGRFFLISFFLRVDVGLFALTTKLFISTGARPIVVVDLQGYP